MANEFEGGFDSEDKVEVCCNQKCTSFFSDGAKIFNIFFFEFWGMLLFSYVVIFWNGIISYPGYWVTQTGMFFSLVISGSFGCGYLNPALVLACMIRKQNRISILHGVLFWIVEYIAAFAGTFLAWAFSDTLTAPFPTVHPTDQQAIIVFLKQLFGSFLFLLGVLILITSDTTFARNNFQTWLSVPLCLIAVCVIFNLGLGTNPAQAIAFQTAYYALSPAETMAVKQVEMSKIWSVIVGATLGGVLAGLFFELIYRPFTKVYRQQLLENGETHKPLKVSILNNSNDSPRRMNNPRRTTDIQMA